MFVTELGTFVKKFHQLWHDGFTAHLDLDTQAGNAWVGLRVQLGQVPGPPHWQVHPYPQQVHTKSESPSRQRRRARRAAAAKATNTNDSEAVEASTAENGKENTEVVAEKVTDSTIVAENSVEKVELKEDAENATIKSTLEDISDEVCPDEVYHGVRNQESLTRRMCSLELYPGQLEDITDFRNKVENYFKERTDVIERVIDCKVEHFGTRVKLVCILSKRRWLGFFNDPQGCYSDLTGIQ